MATMKLSNADYVTLGYGQVEPNHLSAQRNGKIYAQLPIDETISVLENGQFAKYDYVNGKVNMTGEGEWMLVYNEVKIYDVREVDHDFAMINRTKDNIPCPRLFKTDIGDIFTTNTIKATELEVGDKLTIGTDGYLTEAGEDATGMIWAVVKVYSMPDNQPGVKLQRIA